MINDYIHMYSILPAWGHPRPPPQRTAAIRAHYYFERPRQHSVAIWQLLSSSPSEEERGLRGGGRGGWGSTDTFSFSLSRGVLYFSFSAHVTMCTYAPEETGHPYTYIHIHTYTHIYTYTYTCILSCTYTHVYLARKMAEMDFSDG